MVELRETVYFGPKMFSEVKIGESLTRSLNAARSALPEADNSLDWKWRVLLFRSHRRVNKGTALL
jgi:hypothetical protein